MTSRDYVVRASTLATEEGIFLGSKAYKTPLKFLTMKHEKYV